MATKGVESALKKGASKTHVIMQESKGVGTQVRADVKPLTDLGNAERFVEQHRRAILYNVTAKVWLIYKNGHWQSDLGPEINRLAHDTVRRITSETARDDLDAKMKEEIIKHSKKSASKGRIKAMLDLAKWFTGITVHDGLLNADPWLLNCQNGTLNLKTQTIVPHRAEYFITNMVRVPYDPAAACPNWDRFLSTVMGESTEKIDFLRRMVGYILAGVTSEQCMFVLHGSGANGKTTFIEIVRELLADYAMHTTTSSLLHSTSSPIRNDLARLNTARLVSAVEVGMGKRLDEALIKQLTGGDQVTARFLYKEFFEFKPQFKLVIAANHKPEIRGVDHGIWRRIHLIPFEVTIPAVEMDKDLPSKLRNELPGILGWAVRGCSEWQERGLMVPSSIAEATAEYRAEMDLLESFISDRCVNGPDKRTPVSDLYSDYESWAKSACQDPVGKKIFGNLMKQKSYSQVKSGSTRYWRGLEISQQT
jgi:putative DNA primase/helicase